MPEKFDNTKEQSVKHESQDINENNSFNPSDSPRTLPPPNITSNYNPISSFTNSEPRLKNIKEIISIISKNKNQIISKNKNQGGRKKPKKRSMRKRPKKSRTKGGKKSRKRFRKRTTLKCGKRKRRRTRRRR